MLASPQSTSLTKRVAIYEPRLSRPKPYKQSFPLKGNSLELIPALERQRKIDIENQKLLKTLVETESEVKKFQLTESEFLSKSRQFRAAMQ